ncbi:N-acetyltransferase [Candidatus Woesearchaeota archaeon CG11_big_fil_rev_8_21_14_0_20_43_8]|nr:MAG: N-acetyltransferase [Candidatus Woesearchaeota archaeon CG11_big_fil_rev_8_21_14_0_20_43_8]
MRIHKTADVSEKATIGEGTSIWNNAQVREGAILGTGCNISKDVYIDTGVKIGDKVKIQNGVSVYHGVEIEDEVFLGPHMTFTNDLFPRATVWDDSMIGKTVVKKGASIGAHATIVCGAKDSPRVIGKYALVAAGAVVTKNVPDHGFVVGVPARLKGFVCRLAHKMQEKKRLVGFVEMECKICKTTVEIPIKDYEMIK